MVGLIEGATKFFAEIKEQNQLQLQQIEERKEARIRECALQWPLKGVRYEECIRLL
jgi:hypothetical protein